MNNLNLENLHENKCNFVTRIYRITSTKFLHKVIINQAKKDFDDQRRLVFKGFEEAQTELEQANIMLESMFNLYMNKIEFWAIKTLYLNSDRFIIGFILGMFISIIGSIAGTLIYHLFMR